MYLGIDVGHTKIKGALFNRKFKKVASMAKKTKILNPKPEWFEIPIANLWIQIENLLKDLIKGTKPENVEAVGLSGGAGGLYALDKNLNPVSNGVISLDRRSKDIVAKWKKDKTYESIFEISGIPIAYGIVLPLLRWFKENEKRKYDRIAHLLSYKDIVRFKLTNELATDPTDASFSLTNVKSQRYDERLLELAGVAEKIGALSEIKDNSYDIAGYITEEAAKRTGLKKGTPVVVGAHDGCCNTLGVGGIDKNIICSGGGTYSINFLVVDEPIPSHRWICQNFVKKGMWILQGVSPTATINLDWFIDCFCNTEKKEAKEEGKDLYQVCEEKIKGVNTKIIFQPFLVGLSDNMPYQSNASAGFIGIRWGDGKREMLRALYEAVTFMHAIHIEDLQKIRKVDEVRFTGGASRSEFWTQMLADVLNKKVAIVDEEETGCFGAALLAALGIRKIKNLEETKRLIRIKKEYFPKRRNYNKKYRVFKKSCALMGGIWNNLEDLDN